MSASPRLIQGPLEEAQITDALCFAFRTGMSCGSWASLRRVGTRDDWPWSPRSQRSSDSAFPLLLRCSLYMVCFAVTDLYVSFASVLSGGDLPSRTASDLRTPGSRWTSRTPDNRTVCQVSPSEGPRGRIERSSAMPNATFIQHYSPCSTGRRMGPLQTEQSTVARVRRSGLRQREYRGCGTVKVMAALESHVLQWSSARREGGVSLDALESALLAIRALRKRERKSCVHPSQNLRCARAQLGP